MAKISVHELSSFGPSTLETYPFMGEDDNSLDEIKLEEKQLGTLMYRIVRGVQQAGEGVCCKTNIIKGKDHNKRGELV